MAYAGRTLVAPSEELDADLVLVAGTANHLSTESTPAAASASTSPHGSRLDADRRVRCV